MQRRSSWQFSLPPHCVASSGSSTAMMMSATEIVVGRPRPACSRRPGRARCRPARAGAACRTAAPGRTARSSAARRCRQRHRALACRHRQVDHRGHRETAFGRQSHGRLPLRVCPRVAPGQLVRVIGRNSPISDRISQLKVPTSSLELNYSSILLRRSGRSARPWPWRPPQLEAVALQLRNQSARGARRSPPRGRAAGGSPARPGRSCPRRSRRPRSRCLARLLLAPSPRPRR